MKFSELSSELQEQMVDKTERELRRSWIYEWECPVHGVFKQKLGQRVLYGRGCNRCARSKIARDLKRPDDWAERIQSGRYVKRIFTEELISQMVHVEDQEAARRGDLDSHKYVDWMCPKHGVYSQRLYAHWDCKKGMFRQGCPKCGYGTQQGHWEDDIVALFDCPVERNVRGYIKSPGGQWMELDIYCPDLKLAIECNGEYWHQEGDITYEEYLSNQPSRNRNRRVKWEGYHQWKTDRCSEQGITLVHIWYKDWQEDKDKCISVIKQAIEESRS